NISAICTRSRAACSNTRRCPARRSRTCSRASRRCASSPPRPRRGQGRLPPFPLPDAARSPPSLSPTQAGSHPSPRCRRTRFRSYIPTKMPGSCRTFSFVGFPRLPLTPLSETPHVIPAHRIKFLLVLSLRKEREGGVVGLMGGQQALRGFAWLLHADN